LKKSDVIPAGVASISDVLKDATHVLPWSANVQNVYTALDTISFIEGNEYQWLHPGAAEILSSVRFAIDPSSDRMAYHLTHEPVRYDSSAEMISSAVSFGTIQGLPNGRIIILMADHQTTGGYPRLGHVCSAHLPKLAQLGPADSFRFHKISLEDAEKMLFSLQVGLQKIRHSCRQNLGLYYGAHRS
jgi:antagonist of KipI